jgi:hypothetical protein
VFVLLGRREGVSCRVRCEAGWPGEEFEICLEVKVTTEFFKKKLFVIHPFTVLLICTIYGFC